MGGAGGERVNGRGLREACLLGVHTIASGPAPCLTPLLSPGLPSLACPLCWCLVTEQMAILRNRPGP